MSLLMIGYLLFMFSPLLFYQKLVNDTQYFDK